MQCVRKSERKSSSSKIRLVLCSPERVIERSQYAHHLPIHKGGSGPDGRSGWHLLNSAISYLQFRRGDSWRPASHRFHPEVAYYYAGISLLLFIRARVQVGWTAAEIRLALDSEFPAAGGSHEQTARGQGVPLKQQPGRGTLPSAPAVCFCADTARRSA